MLLLFIKVVIFCTSTLPFLIHSTTKVMFDFLDSSYTRGSGKNSSIHIVQSCQKSVTVPGCWTVPRWAFRYPSLAPGIRVSNKLPCVITYAICQKSRPLIKSPNLKNELGHLLSSRRCFSSRITLINDCVTVLFLFIWLLMYINTHFSLTELKTLGLVHLHRGVTTLLQCHRGGVRSINWLQAMPKAPLSDSANPTPLTVWQIITSSDRLFTSLSCGSSHCHYKELRSTETNGHGFKSVK